MIAGSFEFVVHLQPMRRGAGHDRAAVFERGDGGITIALADGAGGTSHGDVAAQAVIDTAQILAGSDADWSLTLATLDRDTARLQGGQTTAIVLVMNDAGIRGASVGDSEAWLVYADHRIEALTAEQARKPLLGAGAQLTSTVAAQLGDATLVVASDGLFRTAKPMDIARIATGADLEAAAAALVDLVRTDAGNVLDDVSIVIARRLVV